jgi:hypothetical protein
MAAGCSLASALADHLLTLPVSWANTVDPQPSQRTVNSLGTETHALRKLNHMPCLCIQTITIHALAAIVFSCRKTYS